MIAPSKDSNANQPKKGSTKQNFSATRLLVWGCIGLLVAAVAFFALKRGTGNAELGTVKQPQKGAETAKRVSPKAATTNKVANAAKTSQPGKGAGAAKKKPPFVKRAGTMQLPDGRVLTFKPPKEGAFRIVHSHGSTYKCDHLGNWEDITPKPIFDNSFEETLVGMATTGNFIPGMLLGLDEKDAIRMLTKPVVVNEGDSEDVVAKKEAVAAAKEAILDYMKDGASLDDFVMEMRKQVVKERFIRGMALKEIVASLKEGRAQDAADMRDAANKMLENDNLRPMNLPAHIEQAIEENK